MAHHAAPLVNKLLHRPGWISDEKYGLAHCMMAPTRGAQLWLEPRVHIEASYTDMLKDGCAILFCGR